MLTAIEKKQLARYEEMMTLPKWRYILVYGVLAWGVSVGILVTIIDLFIDKSGWRYVLQNDLWTNLIGFPIGGIFFGMYMREFMPRQIKRLREKEKAEIS
jgi:hypothetical protein